MACRMTEKSFSPSVCAPSDSVTPNRWRGDREFSGRSMAGTGWRSGNLAPKNTPLGCHGELIRNGQLLDGSGTALVLRHRETGWRSAATDFTRIGIGPAAPRNYTNPENAGDFRRLTSAFFQKRRLLLQTRQRSTRYSVYSGVPTSFPAAGSQRQDVTQPETKPARRIYLHTYFILSDPCGSVPDTRALLSIPSFSLSSYRLCFIGRDSVRADLAGEHGRHEWKAGVGGGSVPFPARRTELQLSARIQIAPGS